MHLLIDMQPCHWYERQLAHICNANVNRILITPITPTKTSNYKITKQRRGTNLTSLHALVHVNTVAWENGPFDVVKQTNQTCPLCNFEPHTTKNKS